MHASGLARFLFAVQLMVSVQSSTSDSTQQHWTHTLAQQQPWDFQNFYSIFLLLLHTFHITDNQEKSLSTDPLS